MTPGRRCSSTDRGLAPRDAGVVLPLVLVLILLGALIVLPMMTYTVAVLNANKVEAEKTRNVEAAKGGIRAALFDPGKLFGRADVANSGCPEDDSDLLPVGGVVVTDVSVTISCTPIGELSANEVFGLDVPVGAVQFQIAPDPDGFADFSGVLASSGDAPPYPDASTDDPGWAWWQSFEWTNPADATDRKTISLPDLPSFADVSRSSTPLTMPGFDCAVFLPGRYPSAVVLDDNGPIRNFYFASGVYYFEAPVIISGDVDVVVGQGLADFGVTNDCADDIQVGANVSVPDGTLYAIDGSTGGATWVLGDHGRLSVADAGGAPSIRFNQRYAPPERGQWSSILSVNGDWSFSAGGPSDDDDFDDAEGDHIVTNVNYVDRSVVMKLDGDGGVTTVPLGQPGAPFVPSHPGLTDEAQVPAPPTDVSGESFGDSILVAFAGVEAEDTNGAIITDYQVGLATGPTDDPTEVSACDASDTMSLVPTIEGPDGTDPWGRSHPENATEPDQYACPVAGLVAGSTYWVAARARNEAGWSDWSTNVEVATSSGDPVASATAPPGGVEVQPYDDESSLPDAAIVTWNHPGQVNGAPVLDYNVEVYRVDEVPDTSVPPMPIETETLIDTAGARCSSGLHMGVGPDSGLEWTPPPTRCVLESLPALVDDPDPDVTTVGYRVNVVARNAIGDSLPGTVDTSLSVTGSSASLPAPPAPRVAFPRSPTPVVDIDASGSGSTIVEIPGYTAVPMGTIRIDNPNGDRIGLVGGLAAGRIEIVADGRSPLPIGYVPSVVMQREVLLTATAGNITSNATVKINSDTSYGVLRWITQ